MADSLLRRPRKPAAMALICSLGAVSGELAGARAQALGHSSTSSAAVTPLLVQRIPKRVCDLTGKKANNGYRVCSYKRLWWEESNRFVKLRISTRALKTIEKNGFSVLATEVGPGLRFSPPTWRNRQFKKCAPRAVSSDYLGDAVPSSSSSLGESTDEALESAEKSELSFAEKAVLFQDAFWRFLRPHTIRGTLLGSTAVLTRALIENPQLINWVLLPKALRGVVALLCGNGYIVGINQIYDVGIDKINKPFLPIAAGDLSVPAAWGLVLGLAALGIGIASTNFGPLITVLYSLGLFLGTIYSVPPLHLKRFAVPAFLIIATVRGFLLNFGVYYATRAALGLQYQWSPAIVFITCFVTVFATVIAITKDLPDIEGDRKFNISTFATKLGVRNISFLGAGLLLANYVGAIVAAIYLPQSFNQKVMIPAHAILAAALVYQTWLLDSAKYTKESIAGFYRFIWNLFYSQYILLPFI